MSTNFDSNDNNVLYHKARKRWNGKVINTARQWNFNDSGSAAPAGSSLSGIRDAIIESGVCGHDFDLNFIM